MLSHKGREAVECIMLADTFCPTVVLQYTVSDFGIRDLIQGRHWVSSVLIVAKKLVICDDRIDISYNLAWSEANPTEPEVLHIHLPKLRVDRAFPLKRI